MSMNFAPDKSCDNIFDAFAKAMVNYFKFKGRTSRYDFWGFNFVNFLVQTFFFLFGMFIIQESKKIYGGIDIASQIFGLVMIIPWLSAMARRLHDTNRSALKWLVAFPLAGIAILGVSIAFAKEQLKSTYVLFSFLILVYFISLLVVLCFRGSEKDNKYGPAVAEDANQRWKGLAMPICMFILPFLGVLAIGMLSGYSKAMNKYKTEKEIAPAIYNLLKEVKNDKNGPVFDGREWHEPASNSETMTITPSGYKIEMKRSGDFYEVSLGEVLPTLCTEIGNYHWGENPDFVNIRINEGPDCYSCVEQPCSITWKYK